MAGTMWFGTLGNMKWVSCPAINVDMSYGGWSDTGIFLNGGAFVFNSDAQHRTYTFVWNLAPQEEIYDILDYEKGIYGDGLVYFLDPFAMDRNVLPTHWAAPGLKVVNGQRPPVRLTTGANPTRVDTTANTIGLPVDTARYVVANNGVELFIPCPPGHTVHIGVFGSVVSGSPSVQANGNAVTLITSTSSTVRTNTTVAGDVTLRLWGSGTIDLRGMIVQVLPTGQSVSPGGWISGRGHSGCRFDNSKTRISGYSAALDKVGASAILVETGSWE